MGVEPAWLLYSAPGELSARFGRNCTAFNSHPVAISSPQHRLVHWRRSVMEQLVSALMDFTYNLKRPKGVFFLEKKR